MNTTVRTGPRDPGQAAPGKPPEGRQRSQAHSARPGRLRSAAPAHPAAPGQPARGPARPARRRPAPAQADSAPPSSRERTGRRPTASTDVHSFAPPTGPASAAAGAAARSGPARTAGRARDARAGRRSASRTPFILLVLGLLSGGLVCLLLINTTLAAASFRISSLQQSNAAAAQRVQELQWQVAAEQSPSSIEQRALRLGLRIQPVLNFIDLRNGHTYTTRSRAGGAYAVPGYTP